MKNADNDEDKKMIVVADGRTPLLPELPSWYWGDCAGDIGAKRTLAHSAKLGNLDYIEKTREFDSDNNLTHEEK